MYKSFHFKIAFRFSLLIVVVGICLLGSMKLVTYASSRPLKSSTKAFDIPSTSTSNCGTWSIVSSPNAGSSNNALYAVSAVSAGNVWAVGWYLDSNNNMLTLVEHWDGSSWNVVSSPNPGSAYNALEGVAAISATNIWAVGFYSNNSSSSTPSQTLIEHWNGKAWSVVSSPSPGSTDGLLFGVSRIPGTNLLWAVGVYNNGNSPGQTLTEYWNGSSWNGTTWSVVSSPNLGSGSNELNGVTAISAKNIWAVGTYNSSVGSYAQTLVEHWDGTTWSVVSSPNSSSANNSLMGIIQVHGTSTLWAVGWYTNTSNTEQTLIEAYC
jgi:hypothetical protein